MSGAPSAARPPTHAGYLPPKGGKLNDQIIAKGCALEMIFFCLAVLYIVSHTRPLSALKSLLSKKLGVRGDRIPHPFRKSFVPSPLSRVRQIRCSTYSCGVPKFTLFS